MNDRAKWLSGLRPGSKVVVSETAIAPPRVTTVEMSRSKTMATAGQAFTPTSWSTRKKARFSWGRSTEL
jgi:hypothetical protein